MPDNQTSNTDPITQAVQTVEQDTAAQIANTRLGQLSVYTCPECGGSLWQIDTAVLIQFRCHVGHVLSGEDLLLEQAQAIDASLWRAARLLEDRNALARQMAPEARERGLAELADWLESEAIQATRQKSRLHEIIEAGVSSAADAGLAP